MKKLLALTLIASLAACGGGGSDTHTASSAPTMFAIDKIEALVGTLTLNGSDSGHNYQLMVSFTPAVASTNPVGALTNIETMVLREDGVVVEQDIVDELFNQSVRLASYSHATGQYTVYNDVATPGPQHVGTIGSKGTFVTYNNPNKTVVLRTASRTWSLDAAGDSQAMFCVNTVFQGQSSVSGSACNLIDAAGHVSARSMKITVNGKTLTLN